MHPFLPGLLALCAAIPAAVAAPNDGVVGAYARVDVGRSHFARMPSTVLQVADSQDLAVKFYLGYRFDERLGLEAGHVRLGSFSEVDRQGDAGPPLGRSARAWFVAASGRLAVAPSLFLQGRLGLSAGRVSGATRPSTTSTLTGDRTAVMLGLGAEYRPSPRLTLTLNHDSYGRVAAHVKARALLFGLHITL
ncbi:outer membrane beta-barrel protein [Rubrivivax rivuli]|nr:outer membrane beta-barrel protein [Rubrivivax rivuli]